LAKEKKSSGAFTRILKLKLLAKFLGLVVFSPNWDLDSSSTHSYNVSNNISGPNNQSLLTTTKSSISNLNSTQALLPIYEVVLQSYKNNNLTLTIPWVVEYLRMMKWDSVSKLSRYYQSCCSLLHSLWKFAPRLTFSSDKFNSNMLFVCFEIETLLTDLFTYTERNKLFWVDFDVEVVGVGVGVGVGGHLGWTDGPGKDGSDKETDNSNIGIDLTPLFCGKRFISQCCPFLDDMHGVLDEIKRGEGRLVKRKMRPLSISFEARDARRSDSNASLSAMNDSFTSISSRKTTDLISAYTPLKIICDENENDELFGGSDEIVESSNNINIVKFIDNDPTSATKPMQNPASFLGSPSPRNRPFSPVMSRSLTPTKVSERRACLCF